MGLRTSAPDLRTCAADDCNETFEFDPANPLKRYHSIQCQKRMRMRRLRKGDRTGGPGGGGKRRQLALFSKQSVSAKRAKPARPETAPLFAMYDNSKYEKHAPVIPAELCALPVIRHYDSPEPPESAELANSKIAEAA